MLRALPPVRVLCSQRRFLRSAARVKMDPGSGAQLVNGKLLQEIRNLEALLHEAAVERERVHDKVHRGQQEAVLWRQQALDYLAATRVAGVGKWSVATLTQMGWGGLALGAAVIVGVIAAIRFFHQPIASSAAQITTAAVKDPQFLEEVQGKLQALVHAVVHHEQSKKDVLGLLDRLLRSDEARATLISLLDRLLRDDVTANALKALLLNPITLDALKSLLVMPQTQEGLRKLLVKVLEEDDLHRSGGVAVRGVVGRTIYPGF